MKYAIETFDLTKKYGDFVAVDALNLKIGDQSIFGLLGPNGAGKTTTIKMLTCLIQPTSGSANVSGYDIISSPNEVRQKIGMVPQLVSLYGDLTARENATLCADYYGLSEDLKEKRIDDLMELVDIKYAENKLVKQLSGGQQQKVSVVASLVHQPDILFLDEPTIGLDPTTKTVLWDLISRLNEEGHTIVLCSHDMYEVDLLCDTVGIIDQGMLAAFDTPQGLKDTILIEKSSKNDDVAKIMGQLKANASIESTESMAKIKGVIEESMGKSSDVKEMSIMISNLNENLLTKLQKLPVVHEIREQSSGRIILSVVDSDEALNDVISIIIANNGNITSISTKEPSLEDVFVKVTAKKAEGE